MGGESVTTLPPWPPVQSVIEESSNTVRTDMLRYFVSCMLGASELSFPTAKRAQRFVLQEMWKGTLDVDREGSSTHVTVNRDRDGVSAVV